MQLGNVPGTRVALGGLVAGIVGNIADFVLHGVLLANTYKQYSQVFAQQEANPAKFALVSVMICLLIAVLFAKTRNMWAASWKGGATFGAFFGMAVFFKNFYYPMVIDGFPYHLAWCWGGIDLINAVLVGAVLGVLIRRD